MSVMSKGIIPDKQKEFIFFLNIAQKEKNRAFGSAYTAFF